MSSVRKSVNNRRVFSVPDDYSLRTTKSRSSSNTRKTEDTAKLVKYIDDNIIGKNSTFCGPYGRRKVLYCDYTASGRSLQFIEDYIIKEVLPSYGNTHATTSITSLQSTLFRQEARDIIRSAVHASDRDAVIFCGHGCAAAINKLISALELSEPPVVFTGPCDHHANLLPWREIGAQIVRINETKEGFLDLSDLENQLQLHYQYGKILIGCFSAASNITGIIADDIATTILLHQYGAYAFWDYATAAPYSQIDMNPVLPEVHQETVNKDAIFFSGHKFIGGVQTPGILIVKKTLFRGHMMESYTDASDFYDTKNVDKYLEDTELREEGGTAAVVETIRAGLVMQLKETVGVTAITQREDKISRQMLAHIRTIPELILLGNGSQLLKRLPIFSFMVRHPRGTFLHHNFICAVLNDVFGIQARGGCACAGPYAQDLLGIDYELAQEYENILLEDKFFDRDHLRHIKKHSSYEILRPGFARISLPFCMSESELAYVMEAVKMVATEAWKLLPQYILNPETGEWRHHTNMMCKDRKWLQSIRYTDGKMVLNERRISGTGTFPQNYSDCLQTARNIFNRARKIARKQPRSDECMILNDHINHLRWFMLPNEAQDLLLGNSQKVKQNVPFTPVSYIGARRSVSDANDAKIRAAYLQNFTPSGSPRHFSLSAIDDRTPKMSCTSPPISVDTNFMYDSDEHQHPVFAIPMQPIQQNVLNFAVGQCVTAPPRMNLEYVPENEPPLSSRNRCHSLGSETSSPVLTCQMKAQLGIDTDDKHSSSHTDLHSIESEANTSSLRSITRTSSGSGSDCSIVGRSSPSCTLNRRGTDELHAYLKVVTKELATEIKSEIREVISKVEDVLENTDSVTDISSSLSLMNDRQNSSSDESKGDSVSANDVAEYLMGMSKEMASEVKSEIREMVSAVDMQLDKPRNSVSVEQSAPSHKCTGAISKYSKRHHTDNLFAHESSLSPLNKSHSSSKLNEDDLTNLEFDHKTSSRLCSTVNSVSSQDSGINLSFHEQDSLSHIETKPRSSSESSASRRVRKNNGLYTSPRPFYLQSDIIEIKAPNVDSNCPSNTDNNSQLDERLKPESEEAKDDAKTSMTRWYCPPKNIWKPALDALTEFDMINNGDKIMVCLSGGKGALSLLHTLHQYQYYARSKGINFTLGAATVEPTSSTYDVQPLIPYLKELEVEYFRDEPEEKNQIVHPGSTNDQSLYSFCNRRKRRRIYSLAKAKGYNVLAIGQHLDDVAENFLMSLFHDGKLQALKAHYLLREHNLRVIRPLIYVREEALRQFSESRNLPITQQKTLPTCNMQPKEKSRTKQILLQQENQFPDLFSNLKTALHPLISFQFSSETDKNCQRCKKRCSSSTVFMTDSELELDTDEEPVVFLKARLRQTGLGQRQLRPCADVEFGGLDSTAAALPQSYKLEKVPIKGRNGAIYNK